MRSTPRSSRASPVARPERAVTAGTAPRRRVRLARVRPWQRVGRLRRALASAPIRKRMITALCLSSFLPALALLYATVFFATGLPPEQRGYLPALGLCALLLMAGGHAGHLGPGARGRPRQPPAAGALAAGRPHRALQPALLRPAPARGAGPGRAKRPGLLPRADRLDRVWGWRHRSRINQAEGTAGPWCNREARWACSALADRESLRGARPSSQLRR